MNQMTYDEFQDLIRRLIIADPIDQRAWTQFYERFEPTIQFYSRVHGRVPWLQGLYQTGDIVGSVWRRCHEKDWVTSKFLGRSVGEVRNYFIDAARDVLNQKIREQRAVKRGRERNVGHNGATDPPAAEQDGPEVLASSEDFVRWFYTQLRAMLPVEADFAHARQIIEGEKTYAEVAFERGTPVHSVRRLFHRHLEELRDRYLQEFE